MSQKYVPIPKYERENGSLHPAPSSVFAAMSRAYDAASQKHGRTETMMAVYNALVHEIETNALGDEETSARINALRDRGIVP